jgi:hypothetical protein
LGGVKLVAGRRSSLLDGVPRSYSSLDDERSTSSAVGLETDPTDD